MRLAVLDVVRAYQYCQLRRRSHVWYKRRGTTLVGKGSARDGEAGLPGEFVAHVGVLHAGRPGVHGRPHWRLVQHVRVNRVGRAVCIAEEDVRLEEHDDSSGDPEGKCLKRVGRKREGSGGSKTRSIPNFDGRVRVA